MRSKGIRTSDFGYALNISTAAAPSLACLALAFLAVSAAAPASGQNATPAASVSIPAAYAQLARAYENADEASLRALLAPDFEFVYVPGTSENLSQYVADWKDSKQNSPDLLVNIRVARLTIGEGIAEVAILLTQTYPRSTHAIVDVQREQDRWELRNGTWILAGAQTINDSVSVDGNVVSSDGPAGSLTTSQREAVVAQLKEIAWPIVTAVPGESSRDLAPLYHAIGPARIVAMGEATHGTSEFFSIKDRIFRFLVEKIGFTVFAMETPWNSGLAIDRYVTTGQGDARCVGRDIRRLGQSRGARSDRMDASVQHHTRRSTGATIRGNRHARQSRRHTGYASTVC